jgi:hypothetical protein
MKKSILAVAVLLGTSAAFAQDLTSKKGETYLPEAGDWSLSIEATPLLGYIQGIFGSNGGSSAGSWSFLNGNNTITGKYFVADDMAYRGGINIGFNSFTEKAYTAALDANGAVDPDADLVIDEKKTTGSNIFLTGGVEWRKGSTRLQGYYGGELGLGFGGGSNVDYTYANAYTWNGTTGTATQTHAVDGTTDLVSVNQKGGVMFGLRGFIGAEYYILPKIAIGGEFGWGLGLQTFGSGSQTATRIEPTAGQTTEQFDTQTVAGGSLFGIGTDNSNPMFGPSGSLNITLVF